MSRRKRPYFVIGLVSLALIGLMSTSRSDVAADQGAQIGGDGAGTGPNAHGHRGMGATSSSSTRVLRAGIVTA